nr:MAG TPA: hypothetical protein [Caudoviricetes sp.]
MMFMNMMTVQKRQKRPLVKLSCFWQELASPLAMKAFTSQIERRKRQ